MKKYILLFIFFIYLPYYAMGQQCIPVEYEGGKIQRIGDMWVEYEGGKIQRIGDMWVEYEGGKIQRIYK